MEENKTSLERREIQQHLCWMLDQFVAYCEQHNLRYHFVGGTLLGAIRHQGFIPWDDDIDVGMPRPDYQRFLELVKTEPIGEYLTVVSGDEGTYSGPYCEMIDKRYILKRSTSQYVMEKYQVLNLFIDIFPQDGWPSDEEKAKKIVTRMNHLRFLNLQSRARLGHGTSVIKAVGKIPVILFAKLLGNQYWNKTIMREAQRFDYDASEYVGAITYGIYGIGERCKREEVLPYTKVTFEGKQYMAPRCWDSYLHNIYGDYMQLPPKEKQINHNMEVYCSINNEDL